MNELAQLTRAVAMLAQARTLDEVTHIRNVAQAAESYAKAEKLGAEAEAFAREVRLRAARKAGDLLRQMADQGTRASRSDAAHASHGRELAHPALADLGVSKAESSRWQRIAAVPEETFESAVAEGKGESAVAKLALVPGRPAQTRTERVAERRERVMALWSKGTPTIQIAELVGAPEGTVTADIVAMREKFPAKYGEKPRVATRKQSMDGLKSAAVQLQGLAEVLDGDLMGDWTQLYSDPEAAPWFDVLQDSLQLVTARLRRMFKERGESVA